MQIKDPEWSKLKGETKKVWIQEDNDNKKIIIAQFVAGSKSIVPVTKNRNLYTVFMSDFNDRDGYDSDFTANTQNSDGIFQFNVNSSLFDTTTNNNSNVEILEGSNLNVNAAAAREGKPPNILQKKQFKSSKMPSGSIAKMMANKQLRVLDKDDDVQGWLTYSTRMKSINYSFCDTLVSGEEPIKDVHYKVNLSHTEELEYRVNLSKQNMIIGGKHLALAGSGANGTIIGLDMLIFYSNNDGKRVSIGITGDHQLTGNRLCCGCSVAKSNVGWIKLYLL